MRSSGRTRHRLGLGGTESQRRSRAVSSTGHQRLMYGRPARTPSLHNLCFKTLIITSPEQSAASLANTSVPVWGAATKDPKDATKPVKLPQCDVLLLLESRKQRLALAHCQHGVASSGTLYSAPEHSFPRAPLPHRLSPPPTGPLPAHTGPI